MNLFGGPKKENPFQFIVLPNTGLQICRGFPLEQRTEEEYTSSWQAACRLADSFQDHPDIKLISDNLAVNDQFESSGWIVEDEENMVYFRMTRASEDAVPTLDIVIDTRRAAGRSVGNLIHLMIGRRFFEETVATIYVDDPKKAGGSRGELIVDFGNSGITAVWFRAGDGPNKEKILAINEPFDPGYRNRTNPQVPSSCFALIKVAGNAAGDDPWGVMGERAEDFLKAFPNCTYQFAPKKYVRFWPERLKSQEPSTAIKGQFGQRDGLHPMLDVVRFVVRNLLSNLVSTIINPRYTAQFPEIYPKVDRIMLTYPLTWRQSDREVFQKLFEEVAEEYLKAGVREVGTSVELICSEPGAVAAYFLWESIFYYGLNGLDLMAGALGKTVREPTLRLLVLDIGGGSTDVAVVESSWQIADDKNIDVQFEMVETMRFNRAGDRLTHLIVTALLQFMRDKYDLNESLDFAEQAQDIHFDLETKRQVVSRLFELSEQAKRHLSESEEAFLLGKEAEQALLRDYGSLARGQDADENVDKNPRFRLTREKLENWIRRDRQRLENSGQDGFMDIFNFLGDLVDALKERGKMPHVAVLSGRSTRLGIINKLVVEKLGMPAHRVRTLKDLLPLTVKRPGHENPDKISVVTGANRFRSGDNIRFITVVEEKLFKRFLGVAKETPEGIVLNEILARPGESSPRTFSIKVPAGGDLRLGHAFRETSKAQIIGVLSNENQMETTVAIDFVDDFEVKLHPAEGVYLREWVPGGDDIIVDNFNDTGKIDSEPQDFIIRHVIADDLPAENLVPAQTPDTAAQGFVPVQQPPSESSS